MPIAVSGTELISTARWWYDRGVTPIPLYHASKHAAIFWKQWAITRPSWREVLQEFATPLYRGLGVLMQNGLTVLDFDQPLYYARWRTETGINSYTVKTGRGYHVYFFLDDPPTTTLSMEGGEVKGNGYVVAPPSFHKSGKQYRILPGDVNWPISAKNIHSLCTKIQLSEKPRREAYRRSTPNLGSKSLIEKIKQQLPITSLLSRHTQLEPTSDDFFIGLCPFHDDNSPSLWVNTRLQICGCFSPHCSANAKHLDVINVYSLLTGINNGEAIIDLARQLGIS